MIKETKLPSKKRVTEEQKAEALKNGIDLTKYAKRTPINQQQRLGIKSRPGWTRALVNKEPGRVEARLEAGWSIVEDANQLNTDGRLQEGRPLGGQASVVVNRRADAPWKEAVYMEIPTVIFEQDKQAELEQTDRAEERIKTGASVEGDPNVSHSIKFNTK